MKYFFIYLLFFISCTDKHFIIYSIHGERLNSNDIYDSDNKSFNNFNLYFSKNDIEKDFEEVNIIATDYYHYGQFFFDKNFMEMLENRTYNIGADALIFEKDKTDFPDYIESYLYFTAIKYKN
tara:strand:- start:33 stop:401 length:369 start_codon:yes stop_codon:yes gene_type:complete